MKRFLSLCLSTFMLANLINIPVLAAESSVKVIAEENFDSGAVLDPLIPNTGVVSDMPDSSSGKCMDIYTGVVRSHTIQLSEAVTSGVVVIDMNMYVPTVYSGTSSFALYGNIGGTDQPLFAITSGGGQLRNSKWQGTKNNIGDQWHNFRTVLDIDSGYYYLLFDGENMSGFINNAYVESLKDGIQTFSIHGGCTMYIDDIKITTYDGMNTFDTYPSNGAESVPIDTDVNVRFNSPVEKSTLTTENITLINTKTSETVDISLSGVTEAAVNISLVEELDYYTKYKLVLSENIITKSGGDSLDYDTVYFRTEQIDIKDFIEVTQSVYENNQSSVTLVNNSDTEQTVSVITALYSNSDNLPQEMVDYTIDEKTVAAGGEESFDSKVFNTEEGKEYTVRVFIWDNITNKNVLAPHIVFGDEYTDTLTDAQPGSGTEFVKKNVNVNSGAVEIDAMTGSGGNLRAAYTVENPSGKLCTIGEKTTNGENGAFGLDFKLSMGSADGSYTIKSKITGDTAVTMDTFMVDTTESLPSAENVKINSNPIVGETVNGDYDFFHLGNLSDSGSSYQWYVCDSKDGAPTEIEGATSRDFTITSEQAGKWIKFSVIPSTEFATGNIAWSGAVAVLSPPEAKNVRIEGKVRAGETVSAVYRYYHISSAQEGETQFRWLYSSGGEYDEIGTEPVLELTDSMVGGSIKLEVTPVSTEYPYTGTAVTTKAQAVSKRPSKSASVSTGTSVYVGPPSVTLPQDTPAKVDSFTDIAGHWAEESVTRLAKDGIINGYDDRSFKPDNNISRAEFVTIIVNALKLSKAENTVEFADVNTQDWFFDTVSVAASNNIVSAAEKFRPDDNITREEMAVVIVNAYKVKYSDDVQSGNGILFADNDKISNWAVESVDKASALGIFSGDDTGNFRPQAFATRAESAAVIYRFLNHETYESAKQKEKEPNRSNMLISLGVLGKALSDENATYNDLAEVMDNISVFCDVSGKEEELLVWEDALKQCLIALNYEDILGVSGDSYSQLLSLGYSEGLLDEITGVTEGGKVSANDFIRLIYNMLFGLPVSNNYTPDSITLKKDNEALITQKLGIKARDGIVTGVPISKLYSKDGVDEGYIEISNNLYKYECGSEVNDLIGDPVRIYIYTDDEEILWIENLSDEYETVTVNWKDIDEATAAEIKYYDGTRLRHETFSGEIPVLNNNVFQGFADTVDSGILNPARGEVKLIDNDDDGEFDIIKVISYDIFVVDYVSITNSMILLKNGAGYIKLEDESSQTDIYYALTRNGEDYDISKLQEWDVLIVRSAENNNLDKFYNIQVVRRSISGKVTGYNQSEEKVYLDGVEYIVSPSLDLSSLQLGRTYEFMFGGNDELAAICAESGYEYGYLVKTHLNNDGDVIIRMRTSGGEDAIYTVSEKVKFNRNDGTKTAEEIYSVFDTHQLIAYNLNADGEIKEIHQAKVGEDEFLFSLDAAKAYRRYYNQQFDAFYQMDSGGVAFFVADVQDGEKFSINHVKVGNTSAYKSNNGVDCEFYDVDELGNAKAAIFYDFANGEIPYRTVPVIVVDKITQALNDEGDAGNVIYFYEDGVYKSLFLADNVEKAEAIQHPYKHHDAINSVFDLQRGDVVEYATDTDGNFAVYRPVFITSAENNFGEYSQTESGIQPLYDSLYNKIDYADNGNFVMNYGANKRRYSTVATTSFIRYDSKKDELTIASKDDIFGANSVGSDASTVFALRMWTQLKLVVIYD